jgi:hypothetical protein
MTKSKTLPVLDASKSVTGRKIGLFSANRAAVSGNPSLKELMSHSLGSDSNVSFRLQELHDWPAGDKAADLKNATVRRAAIPPQQIGLKLTHGEVVFASISDKDLHLLQTNPFKNLDTRCASPRSLRQILGLRCGTLRYLNNSYRGCFSGFAFFSFSN